MEKINAVRIDFEGEQSQLEAAVDCVKRLGRDTVFVQNSRRTQAYSRTGLLAAMGRRKHYFDRAGFLLHFWVRPSDEDLALAALNHECRVHQSARASIFSSAVIIRGESELCAEISKPCNPLPGNDKVIIGDLALLTCIVPRGLGTGIAKIAIDLGCSVPFITYGLGSGMRDKLGLMRITIPAEKEVLRLLVPFHDGRLIVSTLIDEGGLDKAGRGFLTLNPVRRGIIDTRSLEGEQDHAANIEQIIAAIDGLSGSTLWRRRFEGENKAGSHSFRSNLVGLCTYSDDGSAAALSSAAMGAGAPGATVSELRSRSHERRSHDATVMVLNAEHADEITAAIEQREGRGAREFMELQRCPLAFSYQRRSTV